MHFKKPFKTAALKYIKIARTSALKYDGWQEQEHRSQGTATREDWRARGQVIFFAFCLLVVYWQEILAMSPWAGIVIVSALLQVVLADWLDDIPCKLL
jgi:hypothetical protein